MQCVLIVGKTHVITVPVKLSRVQNDLHKGHPDTKFCFSTIHHLEELASLLGPNDVLFLSQDDKARVPIGMAAAQKQALLLMHMEYRVKLPDHNWVVANRHKLIPSVIAGIVIAPNGKGDPKAVTYSGPTSISIRSGKHSSSTAASHAKDFEQLLLCPQFDVITKNSKKCVKPVYICTVDGGGDENPRYPKVINWSIYTFKKYDFDAYFVVTNAPHRSAYNRVERRMAPLSRQLTGVILPHDKFGTHLDASGDTIDDELEVKNFKHAGEALSEIWNGLVIDRHPTVACYIDPEESELDIKEIENQKDLDWETKHLRRSQYCLQIVKCMDRKCCKPFRSSYLKIEPDRFLPLPIFLNQSENGLISVPLDSTVKSFCPSILMPECQLKTFLPDDVKASYTKLPYDLFCPSLKDKLQDRLCKICHEYFTSQAMMKEHLKIHKNCKVQINVKKVRPVRVAAKRANELLAVIASNENNEEEFCEWIDESLVDTIDVEASTTEICQTPILHIDDVMTCPWEEDLDQVWSFDDDE